MKRSSRLPFGPAVAVLLFGGFFVLPFTTGCMTRSAVSEPTSAAAKSAAVGPITVHYHRFDGDYTDASLWTWDARKQNELSPEESEIFATGKDDFGVVFVLNPGKYGKDDGPDDAIGFIPRLHKDWNRKDGTDRTWTGKLGNEIWLIGNDPEIYTQKPETSPKVAFAFVDGPRKLLLNLSHPVAVAEATADTVSIVAKDGSKVVPALVTPLQVQDGRSRMLEVVLSQDLEYETKEYQIGLTGYRPAPPKLRLVLDDATRYLPSKHMGAEYTPGATTFRAFSPQAESVSVVLYDQAVGHKGRKVVPMAKAGSGSWEVKVAEDLEGKFYRLLVNTAKYGESEIVDPEATNTTGFDGNARITDLRKLDPAGFRPVKRPEFGDAPTDAIIYQLHVHDFTVTPSSGVSEAHRGKFMAFTEKDTHLPTDEKIKTVVEHLKELGVTHVQLQPIQDCDNDETKDEYNWGYMTAFFESPDGWFASNIRDESRIREFKLLVKSLHDANIGVIMDVVYNHTGTQSSFEHLAPGYYLRMRDDGSYWNGSGTGNEFRSEAPMGRKFIVDSLKFWVDEYGVDGFRFDLMGLIDMDTMKQVRSELKAVYPNVLVYGEPWAATGPENAGIKQIGYKDVVKGSGLAAFNDTFRDAIKGSPEGDDPGYIVNGAARRQELKVGLMGSIDGWASSPTESINYTDVHDNLILWDKISRSAKNATPEDRKKMQMLAGGILGVSQGIMLLHTGADFLRTKNSEHNSYRNAKVNEVDWNFKKTNHDVFEYYKGIIAIRKAHPVFRLDNAQDVRKRVSFEEAVRPSPESIMVKLDGAGLAGESWKEGWVFINPTSLDQTFTIPAQGEFDVYANGAMASSTSTGKATGALKVPARSLAILGR